MSGERPDGFYWVRATEASRWLPAEVSGDDAFVLYSASLGGHAGYKQTIHEWGERIPDNDTLRRQSEAIDLLAAAFGDYCEDNPDPDSFPIGWAARAQDIIGSERANEIYNRRTRKDPSRWELCHHDILKRDCDHCRDASDEGAKNRPAPGADGTDPANPLWVESDEAEHDPVCDDDDPTEWVNAEGKTMSEVEPVLGNLSIKHAQEKFGEPAEDRSQPPPGYSIAEQLPGYPGDKACHRVALNGAGPFVGSRDRCRVGAWEHYDAIAKPAYDAGFREGQKQMATDVRPANDALGKLIGIFVEVGMPADADPGLWVKDREEQLYAERAANGQLHDEARQREGELEKLRRLNHAMAKDRDRYRDEARAHRATIDTIRGAL